MGCVHSKQRIRESTSNSGEEEMSQLGHSELMEEVENLLQLHSKLIEEVKNFLQLHRQGKLFTKNELRLRIDQLKYSLFQLK